jgi:lysozyme
MKTSINGIRLIKENEGCQLKAYQCPAGIWTIGFGNTFYEDKTKVKKGDVITQTRADKLFLNLLPKFEEIIDSKIKIDITQNQYDALISHTWNTGGSDTLFKLVNSKSNKEAITTWFTTKYTTGAGKVLPGLVKRRKEECDLYFKK